MGRRLFTTVGLALAVLGGAARAPALAGPPESEVEAESTPAVPPGTDAEDMAPTAIPPAAIAPDGPPPAKPVPDEAPPATDPAPEDPAVQPVQVPETNPGLPPAQEPADGVARVSAPAGAPASPFVLPADGLPTGVQSLGLTVEVKAPSVVNLNGRSKVRILVKNSGKADAAGVDLRYTLPEEFELLDCQPSDPERSGPILTWHLGNLASGAERTVELGLKPVRVGTLVDHVATVVTTAGARSRTTIQEPKLKVDIAPHSGSTTVLKGRPVRFNIAVSNPGTGPATGVVVQVKLDPGLRFPDNTRSGQNAEVIEYPLIEPLAAGQRVELPPLDVDSVVGGTQRCLVVAHSPDVREDAAQHRASLDMTVVEPKLKIELSGPPRRFTDTKATYGLRVSNPGTAPARNVTVAAYLQEGGMLVSEPGDSPGRPQYDRYRRRLLWTLPQLAEGAQVDLQFQVQFSGIQLYKVGAAAVAEGLAQVQDSFATDVTGMADVNYQVTENRRVLDVGETTVFEVTIKNTGSKDAEKLLVRAALSDNLKVVRTAGTDEDAQGSPDGREVVFPYIDRLAPGAELVLAIQVKAVKPGTATCQVFLLHEELEGQALSKMTYTRITEAAQPRPR